MKHRTGLMKTLVIAFAMTAIATSLSLSSVARAAPVSRAEANVLSFNGSLNQSTVAAMTADAHTITSGWTNASYDNAHGMVVQVAPGDFSVGFGSYIPESYSGPGTLYLHRVLITNQAGVVVLNENFDGWAQSSTSTSGAVTRSVYTTAGGRSWDTYADTSNFYTGGGNAFAATDSNGDAGMVYPLDGGGPFSVLIRTVVTAPPGTTELRINVDWRYSVSMFGSEPRKFSIGLQRGDVDPEHLFSFGAAPPAAIPTMSEWAMIFMGGLMAIGAAVFLQRRRNDTRPS